MGNNRSVPNRIEKNPLLILLIALISSTILASITPVSSPEEPLWMETNGPPGGSFGLIEFNPGNPDIMYAGSGYTFFRSEDGGDTWTRVHQLHALTETLELGVRALEFDPRDPNILYLGCRGGVFKSTDSGVTWTSKTGGLEGLCVQAITVDPLDPDIVYFLASYGGDENFVYKSLNGGDRWTDISSSLTSTREMSMLKAVRHDELYSGGGFEIARDGELYHSTDGGATSGVRRNPLRGTRRHWRWRRGGKT